jgi:hypothetical protein
MAGTVRIEMNPAGIRALLTDEGVGADLLRRATDVAAAAGGGEDFVPSVYLGRSRFRASVITATKAGREAEATSLALTRAIDAGR